MGHKINWRGRRGDFLPWLTLLTLGIMAAAAVVAYISYQQASVALVIERDRQVAFLSAARLSTELSKFSDELWTLARKKDIYEGYLVNQRTALGEARRRLVVFDGGVVLLDNFGKVRGAEPEIFGIYGSDWSGSNFFRQQVTSTSAFFSDIINSPTDGSVSVVVSVPVRSDNGEFVGVLAGIFRLGESQTSAFYASIVRLRLGHSGNTYVLDGTGRILYDSSYQEIGQAFNIPGLSGAALRGRSGAMRTRDAAGHDILAAYAPVPGTTWTLVIEEDWAALTSTTQPYARILLLLMALGIILPVVSVVLAIRRRAVATLAGREGEEEIRAAGSFRRLLLPEQTPMLAGWNLAACHQPAGATGGDFYDFLILPDGCLMLTLGEVTFGGSAAVHAMATIRAALRGFALHSIAPADALTCGNKVIYPELQPSVSFACLYAILDPASGRLEFANAGYSAPYSCRGGDVTELSAAGLPLGSRFEIEYEQSETIIQPGERVIFYSDGLAKVRNAQGEVFGLARLKSILRDHRGNAQQVTQAVLSEVREFTGGKLAYEDDVTLIVLQRNASDRQMEQD